MQFSQQDLTLQYISSSYQAVVQQYLPTGSTMYLLDGFGNAIIGIPSSSYGDNIITSNQTSSIVSNTASYSVTATSASHGLSADTSTISLYSDYAELSGTASLSVHADFATSASWSSASLTSKSASYALSSSNSNFSATASLAQNSVSASYALTASYVSGSNSISASYSLTSSIATSASYAPTNATTLFTASTYQITASSAISASYAPVSPTISASYASTASISTSASYAPTTATTLFTSSTYQVTSSVAISSSWSSTSSVSISSSYAPTTATFLFTGSTYQITSSIAVTASWAPSASVSISSSYAPTTATTLFTASTYQITSSATISSSWAATSSIATSASYLSGSNAIVRNLNVLNSGSSGITDVLINPTVKTSGNLLDLQVNGSSAARVSYDGTYYGNNLYVNSYIGARYYSPLNSAQDIIFKNYTGVEIARITNSGSMAIGTSTASAILDISGSSSSNLLQLSSPLNNNILFVSGSGNIGIGTNAPSFQFQIGIDTGSGHYNNLPNFYVDSNGNAKAYGNIGSVNGYGSFHNVSVGNPVYGNSTVAGVNGYINLQNSDAEALSINSGVNSTNTSSIVLINARYSSSVNPILLQVQGNGVNLLSVNSTGSIYTSGSITASNALFNGNAIVYGYNTGSLSVNTIQIGSGQNTTTALNDNATIIGIGAGAKTKMTASSATVIGKNAGGNLTNAGNSTIIGSYAGQNATSASFSIMIGSYAGNSSTNAGNATMVGYSAGYFPSDTRNSTLIGFAAGYTATTLINATIVGYNAGRYTYDASNSTFLGYQADGISGSTAQTSIAIGFNAKVSGSNQCVIGGTGSNAVKVSIGGQSAVNTLDVVGNISCSVITASLFYGTASYVTNALSASYSRIAMSASYAPSSPSVSASYALSSSYSTIQLPDITDDTVNHRIGINQPVPVYDLDVSGTIGNSVGDLQLTSVTGLTKIQSPDLSNEVSFQIGNGIDVSTWINMPAAGAAYSGIGDGGNGANPWLVKIGGNGQFVVDAVAGDLCMRNLGGGIAFTTDNSTYNSNIYLKGQSVGVRTNDPQYTLDVRGDIRSTTNVTASGIVAQNYIKLPYSSSIYSLIPTVTTGSAYFSTSSAGNNLNVYNGVTWKSASLDGTASYSLGMPSIKSGIVSGSTFGGTILTSSVISFTKPFPNNNYTINITSENLRNYTIQNKVPGSFVISSNSSLAATGLVFWQAMSVGEFY